MAISPKELEKNLAEEVLLMEQTIDKSLKPYKIYKDETVTISAPKNMSQRHFKLLHSKYKAAGWSKITWEVDFSDGDIIQFTY